MDDELVTYSLDIKEETQLEDANVEPPTVGSSNLHHYADIPERSASKVAQAIIELTKLSSDKTVDLLFRGRLLAMISFLYFYTKSPQHAWTKASILASAAAGRGPYFARQIREWTLAYLEDFVTLPVNVYSSWATGALEDEDLVQEIHEKIQGLDKKYLAAMDQVHLLNTPEMLQ